MGGSEVLLKPKYCVVLLVDFRVESGVIPDIVNSDETPTEHLLTRQARRLWSARQTRAMRKLLLARLWHTLRSPAGSLGEPPAETICVGTFGVNSCLLPKSLYKRGVAIIVPPIESTPPRPCFQKLRIAPFEGIAVPPESADFSNSSGGL
jgi:hypothetical protein